MSPGAAPVPETSLFDPVALAIVLGGMLLATLARAGPADCALALRAAARLARGGFDETANRRALARWAREVRARGLLGAEAPPPPDPTLARALDALVRSGSAGAFAALCQSARERRIARANRAALVFEQAGELAPVFGLVGTLFAMTQIAPTGADAGAGGAVAATFGAIATAVLSSLYGVLSAHFALLPLAQAITRRSAAEQAARDALVGWFVEDIADALAPGGRPARIARLKPVV